MAVAVFEAGTGPVDAWMGTMRLSMFQLSLRPIEPFVCLSLVGVRKLHVFLGIYVYMACGGSAKVKVPANEGVVAEAALYPQIRWCCCMSQSSTSLASSSTSQRTEITITPSARSTLLHTCYTSHLLLLIIILSPTRSHTHPAKTRRLIPLLLGTSTLQDIPPIPPTTPIAFLALSWLLQTADARAEIGVFLLGGC